MLTASSVSKLKDKISGSVLLPQDVGYEDVRPWTLRQSQRHNAALIVFAYTVDDVRYVFDFARAMGFRVAIQTTGHGSSRVGSDTILLIPLFKKGIEVNPLEQTVSLPAGSRWIDVNKATSPYNLTGLHGLFPWVGVIGYLLYGGVSPYIGQYGWGVNTIEELQVVTVGGEVHSVVPESDLYWALCGAGGSYGFVSKIKLRIFPRLPLLNIKKIFTIDPAQAIECLSFFREWTSFAPLELTSLIAFKYIGDQLNVIVEGYWCGKPEQALQQFNFWEKHNPGEIICEDMELLPQSEISPTPSYSTMTGGELFSELSDSLISVLAQYGTRHSVLTDLIVRHLGEHANALCNCAPLGRYSLSMYGQLVNPAAELAFSSISMEVSRSVQPFITGRYMNFAVPDSVERLYKPTFEKSLTRLCQIKNEYDPNNIIKGGLSN